MALIIGFRHYHQAQHSRKILEELLLQLFADVAATEKVAVSSEVAAAPRRFKADPSTEPAVDFEVRTFTDGSGQFQLAGTLVDFVEDQGAGIVYLQDLAGAKHGIPSSRLSEADQQWVRRESKRRHRRQVEANKKLAWKRMGIILGVFACLFLLTFACMGCVFIIPVLDALRHISN